MPRHSLSHFSFFNWFFDLFRRSTIFLSDKMTCGAADGTMTNYYDRRFGAWHQQLKVHKINFNIRFLIVPSSKGQTFRHHSWSCRRMIITQIYAFLQRHVNNREWMMTVTASQNPNCEVFECDPAETRFFRRKPMIFTFLKKTNSFLFLGAPIRLWFAQTLWQTQLTIAQNIAFEKKNPFDFGFSSNSYCTGFNRHRK